MASPLTAAPQDVRHVVPPQMNGLQGEFAPGVHDPAPLQAPISVCDGGAPPHDALPHGVLAPYCSHAPPAAHLPSVPHDAGVVTGQVPLGSTLPAVTLPQVPSAPPVAAAEHAWHWPLHAELQQKPLTQKPLVHWLPPEHGEPWPSLGVHVPALQ